MKIKNYFILGCLALVAVPAMATDYALNFDESATLSRSDRHFDGLTLNVNGTSQAYTRNGGTPYPAYINFVNSGFCFKAKPGDTLTPSAAFTGAWMHNYIYIDYNNNGQFDGSINADGTVEGNEIVAFSNYSADGSNWYNSAGVSTDRSSFTSPAFTIPEGTPFGMYRLRTKIDWNNYDPAGCVDAGNSIITNGGGIIDYLINIHGDKSVISAVANEDGTITAADGSDLNNTEANYGETYTIKVVPAEGKTIESLIIKYGYNLDGEDTDAHGNVQYQTAVIPASEIVDNTYTISAEYMDSYVSVELSEDPADMYAVSVSKNQAYTHASRRFYELKLTSTTDGEQTYENENVEKVYSLADFKFAAKAGDTVTPFVKMSNTETAWMNSYFYIDYNNDGTFDASINSDATLPEGSELVAFSAVSSGYGTILVNNAGTTTGNSTLQSAPFTIPVGTANGIYRLRAKIDWQSTDPAGSSTLLSNGGGILDCLLNVHGDNVAVTAVTAESGTIEVPTNATFGEDLEITIRPNDKCSFDQLVIRHGYNLDGKEFAHGNKQWSEITVTTDDVEEATANPAPGMRAVKTPATGVYTYTIPASMVDGDIMIIPTFLDEFLTGISNTKKNDFKVIAGAGSITINAENATKVTVFDTLGHVVAKTTVDGSKTINVNPGLYIVNNTKVIVR